MRIATCLSGAVLALLAPGIVLALEANEIFKRADPGVVVIVAEGAKRTDDRLVSGVLVEPLEIVTVCRGVVDAVKLTVKQGSVQRSAKLRFQDAARDLCQLRLDDAFPSAKPVTNFVLSKELEVGQPVYAIGSPRGLEHTISRGIVSALREMKEEVGNLVQTDAAISPGRAVGVCSIPKGASSASSPSGSRMRRTSTSPFPQSGFRKSPNAIAIALPTSMQCPRGARVNERPNRLMPPLAGYRGLVTAGNTS